MLVLSRKKNQGIVIGEDIRVIVLEVRGEQVQLGIQAPRSVSVHRDEIWETIRSVNEEAASSDPESLDALKGLVQKPAKDGDQGAG